MGPFDWNKLLIRYQATSQKPQSHSMSLYCRHITFQYCTVDARGPIKLIYHIPGTNALHCVQSWMDPLGRQSIQQSCNLPHQNGKNSVAVRFFMAPNMSKQVPDLLHGHQIGACPTTALHGYILQCPCMCAAEPRSGEVRAHSMLAASMRFTSWRRMSMSSFSKVSLGLKWVPHCNYHSAAHCQRKDTHSNKIQRRVSTCIPMAPDTRHR